MFHVRRCAGKIENTLGVISEKCALLLAVVVTAGCFGDIGADDPAIMPTIDAAPAAADAAPPLPDAEIVVAPCVEGDAQATGPDGTCYFLKYGGAMDGPMTRDEAKSECVELGGDLATITSAPEQLILADLAEAAALTGTPVENVRDDYWIGATDIALEGTFVWDSGEPFVFNAWRMGEPNNSGGLDEMGNPRPENCAILEGDQRTWDDRRCDAAYGYLCERPPGAMAN